MASTPVPPVLAIRLFGETEVQVEGVVARLPSRRAIWLLALLALRDGRPIERQKLAGLLWPESSHAGALHNLRQTLAGLRRSLGRAGNLIEGASSRSVFLRPGPEVWVDVVEFDRACGEGSVSGFERAVSIYRGPLIPGCDEPFARDEREHRERSFIESAEQVAAHYASANDFASARAMLDRVLAVDPYRESASRALMALLAESGETAAAVDLYRNLRLNLRRDLNAEPDPETTAVYKAIRRGAVTKAEPRAARTKPIARMPVPLTTLLGRESEVREVISLVERCRLVTLTGVGGVGKTRLAIAVAETLGANYLDGVHFVDLAPLQEPSRVPSTIAGFLDLAEQPKRPVLDSLAESIRGLDMLVVVDNCEHLAEGVAATLEVLLSASPGLHVLATSRQSLGVAGEFVWRVPSLGTPASPDPNETGRSEYLKGSNAVRLFLDRASQAGGAAASSEVELEAIGSICRRLDGIPLAIELAAARTNVLTPMEIEARLEDRFSVLSRSSRTVARHQTLGAAMEWSWDLLSDAERRMMMQLSVFRGGWSLEAADGVSGSSSLDLIASLVDRSMVVSNPGSETTRFSMLETIRQFTTEKLRQTPGWEAFLDRHRDFFLEFAVLAQTKNNGPEERVWFKRVESEHDNLRAAHDWSHQRGQHEKGLRLAVALARFWDTCGHLAEGRTRLEMSIDKARSSAAPDLISRACVHAGWMATVQHDFVAAQGHYEVGLIHVSKTGDRPGMAKVLNCLAVAATYAGDLPKAQDMLKESLQIFKDLGMTGNVAVVLTNLGETALALEDNVAAGAYLRQSVESIDTDDGKDLEVLALALRSLSLVDFRQHRFEEARASSRKALRLFANAAAFVSVPKALNQIAIVETAFDEWERVALLLGASAGLATSQGTPLEDRLSRERGVAEAGAISALGAAGFQLAYDRGRGMSMEQAIDCALEDSPLAQG